MVVGHLHEVKVLENQQMLVQKRNVQVTVCRLPCSTLQCFPNSLTVKKKKTTKVLPMILACLLQIPYYLPYLNTYSFLLCSFHSIYTNFLIPPILEATFHQDNFALSVPSTKNALPGLPWWSSG